MKRKHSGPLQEITVVSVNARGIKSKLTSLKRIITELNPEIVALQETKLKEKEKITVAGYEWIDGNRKNQSGGGGVGFLVHTSILKNTIREPSSLIPDKTELRWIRLTLSCNAQICFGVFYGKQETDAADITQDDYITLQDQISSYLSQNYHIILLGDFNAKIGADDIGIPGGDPTITRNGIMLRNLIQNTGLVILNSTPICEGLFTRINTQNPDERSIIDFALASPSMVPSVSKMVIDEHEDYLQTAQCQNQN